MDQLIEKLQLSEQEIQCAKEDLQSKDQIIDVISRKYLNFKDIIISFQFQDLKNKLDTSQATISDLEFKTLELSSSMVQTECDSREEVMVKKSTVQYITN